MAFYLKMSTGVPIDRISHHCTVLRARKGRRARKGQKIFPRARARVLGKKSTNPTEFCMHYWRKHAKLGGVF